MEMAQALNELNSMTLCRSRLELDLALEDAGTKLVCIYFTAPWDRPSALTEPALQSLIDKEFNEVIFLKVKVPELEDVGIMYLVEEFPSFVFIKRKVKLDDYTGENLEAFQQTIERLKPVIVPIND